MKSKKREIVLYLPPINKLGNIAFRKTCLFYGADFVSTEMIRIDKLLNNDEGTLRKLLISKEDINKTIIQIIAIDISTIKDGVLFIINYLKNKEIISNSKEIIEINYNMGCPQSSLCKNECGGGIIGNPKLVENVANELKKIEDLFKIKTSIKIRLGINRDNIKIIKKSGISKVYIHGRTLKDSYNNKATYEEIGRVIRDNPEMEIIANGDVFDLESFNKILKETKTKSVLIGRGALQNPMIFSYLKLNNDLNINKNGDLFFKKISVIKKYISFAKKEDITISQIKSNLAYMSKNVIGGSKFREVINNIKTKEEIIDYIENFKF